MPKPLSMVDPFTIYAATPVGANTRHLGFLRSAPNNIKNNDEKSHLLMF